MGHLTGLARMAIVSLALSSLTACTPSPPGQINRKENIVMRPQKQQVVDLLNAIVTGAGEPVSVINPDKYIQHNLGAADGVGGFKGLQQIVPKGAQLKPVRIFQDGDYVFAHTEYDVFAPMIGFDVFRFENGTIVEHWDNLQAKAGPNPSGRSMIDGPTEAQDLDKTEANKALARSFVEDVLMNGKLDRIASYCDGDSYIQHHPQIADGVGSLTEAFKGMAAAGITSSYNRIHLVLGEGNFVLVVSEGHFNEKPTSFYDMFRLENGKVAEHWDVVETIAPRSEWKNDNGKF
jgi:predicted SnoaL-like aldol condensation-catalyzing enzyme